MVPLSTETLALPRPMDEARSAQMRGHPSVPPISYQEFAGPRSEAGSFVPAAILDLGAPAALARLRRVAFGWPTWPAEDRLAWLRSQEIVLPPRALAEPDAAILPGGAVVLRGPDGILVCDPLEAITFSEPEARRLRNALRRRADALHLLHREAGVVQVAQLPKTLPAQAVTIVPDASRLSGRAAVPGPALVQWCGRGAVAWPMVAAPIPFAVAGSVTAAAVSPRGAPVEAALWHAPQVGARCRLLGPGIAEHSSDLLADEIPDDMRHAIVEFCLAHREGLTRRIAVALAMLPSCFYADATVPPGGQPDGWVDGMAHIHAATQQQALLGLENVADPLAVIRALRGIIDQPDALVFAEVDDATHGTPHGAPVPLWHDAAWFLARRTPANGRIGVIVAAPAMPVDLYVLASNLAAATGAPVLAAAPGWGFCHRIGPDGTEWGNAAWFGMGAGLDEMDILIGDIAARE
jgi:hypothetical protein